MRLPDNTVGYIHIETGYPEQPPFHPSCAYPEYPFSEIGAQSNDVYEAIRTLFFNLGLDEENYGTEKWNPLGEIIQAGNRVLLKPNFVRHYHLSGKDINSVITHGSVIRTVLDYVYIALGQTGAITIGDAPLQQANIELIWEIDGIAAIQQFYAGKGCNVSLVDFRREVTIRKPETNIRYDRIFRHRDDEYSTVDLGEDSFLFPIINDFKKFRVTMYNPKVMLKHHNPNKNEYIIPASVLESDVVLNLPKMKTHMKAGITCCLKNLVGINGNKDWLPHHRIGSQEESGDQYRKKDTLKYLATLLSEKREVVDGVLLQKSLRFLQRVLLKLSKLSVGDAIMDGCWSGNDTVWRMVLDLNLLILYADKQGTMTSQIQRKVFSIVDGIIAGEGDGPMNPDPKHIGVLTAGKNSVLMDVFHSYLMGFDYNKIALLREGLKCRRFTTNDPNTIIVRATKEKADTINAFISKISYNFTPPSGWEEILCRPKDLS